MKRLDQGLGALGLLSLAAALALLLTIGIPITVSKDKVELKDWLGFAGNLLGAIFTVLAAVIAWYAVQRQIRVQREANLLSVMTREETRLENEIHAHKVCTEFLWNVHAAHEYRAAPLDSISELTKYIDELTAMGLSSDYIEIRRSLQAKVISEISPNLSDSVIFACVNLMTSAVLLRTTYGLIDAHGVTEEPVITGARKNLVAKQRNVMVTRDQLVTAEIEISLRLLRFRKRIEGALTAVDHS